MLFEDIEVAPPCGLVGLRAPYMSRRAGWPLEPMKAASRMIARRPLSMYPRVPYMRDEVIDSC